MRSIPGGPPWAVKGDSLVTAPVGSAEPVKIYKPRRDLADFRDNKGEKNVTHNHTYTRTQHKNTTIFIYYIFYNGILRTQNK